MRYLTTVVVQEGEIAQRYKHRVSDRPLFSDKWLSVGQKTYNINYVISIETYFIETLDEGSKGC